MSQSPGCERLRLALLLSLFLVAGSLRGAERIPYAQDKPPGPPLSPEEAVRKMTLPDGFTAEIVAAEPQIANPVAMTFDERGRIWVTESFEYPRSEPGPGRDRVKILEDTDQDGRVDKVTVFLEGLNIPSGIAVGYGGVWVANAPDILFVQDTDGDGVADRQEVVVTGFGRTDTHELPNSLTWGPDGWLYGLNGVFNRCHVKYPEGSPLAKSRPDGWQFNAAMFRIHPRTREFQLFAEGTSNPWGIAFDNEGSAFVSACVIDHLWHIVETGYYHRQAGAYPPHTWKIESIVKHKHQKAAYCGLTFFDSDAYPEPFREKLYMGNIHGNCINVDKLARDGSSYAATGEPDFLSANDAWFMPVVQKTGPDGCLYVLDWYDRFHCYQDARRYPAEVERSKGRLYRVRYKQTPRAPAFDLSRETDEQLIERLKSPNVFYRDVAQRLLAERSHPASLKALEALVLDPRAPPKGRQHALWALISSRRDVPAELVARLLEQNDPKLVAWGVRAAGNLGPAASKPELATAIAALADNPATRDPDQLLQLAIAIGKLRFAEGARLNNEAQTAALLSVLARSESDPLLARIVWKNLHPLIEVDPNGFMNQLGMWEKNGSIPPGITLLSPRIAERVLTGRDFDSRPIGTLFRILKAGDIPSAKSFLATLAARMQSAEIPHEHLPTLRRRLEPLLAAHIEAGAADPLALEAAIVALSWKDSSPLDFVRRSFTGDLPEDARIRALGGLIAAADPMLLTVVEPILLGTPGSATGGSPEFRRQVLAALGQFDDPRVGTLILKAYRTLPDDVRPVAINTLTQRTAWAGPLLAAVARKEISAEALNVNQVRKVLASGDPQLAAEVKKHWGAIRETRNPERELVVTAMRALIRRTPGEAHRGHEVFKKTCGQCHKIYGEGQEVGPDITLNGRNSYDQLLSNVFDPSLVIGAAYQARTIVTTKGRVVTGLPVEESEQRVLLKVQGGKQEAIPRGEIEEMKISELSLMPEDVERTLKPQEIADLFAFLTLDKPPSDPSARRLSGIESVSVRSTSDPAQFGPIVAEFAPGFTLSAVGEGGLAMIHNHHGRLAVVRTHPPEKGVPCRLTRKVDLPADKKTKLRIAVSYDPRGDWELIVRANGKKLYDGEISQQSTVDYWADIEIDLTPFAGQQVELEVENHPDEWSFEYAYWSHVELVSE